MMKALLGAISREPAPVLPPGWDAVSYAKAVKRVERMSIHDLLEFADAAGSGMALAFQDHRRDGDLDSLGEIEHVLPALWAIVQELKTRARAVELADSMG